MAVEKKPATDRISPFTKVFSADFSGFSARATRQPWERTDVEKAADHKKASEHSTMRPPSMAAGTKTGGHHTAQRPARDSRPHARKRGNGGRVDEHGRPPVG
jgi:hypothetical protein